MSENRPYDIFISYRRHGGVKYVRPLKAELELRGYKVFLDYDELKDGFFDKRIMDAIEQAPIFVFMLSAHSLDRCVNDDDWVRKEIEFAVSKKRHFVPVNPNKEFDGFPDNVPEQIKQSLGQHQFSHIDFEQLFESSVREMDEYRIRPILKERLREQPKGSAGANVPRLTMINYDVFISCKSEDYPYAHLIYKFLTDELGYVVFLADAELRKKGVAEYGEVIDEALDSAEHLILFSSKVEYINSSYVKNEWRTFLEEKRSGRKPGNILTVLKDVTISSLPISLRHFQSFTYDRYIDVKDFLPHSTSKHSSISTPALAKTDKVGDYYNDGVREEAERKAREKAERKAREEAERKAREEAERKAREEAERKAREEAERKAREEAERKAREEAERKAREEAERKTTLGLILYSLKAKHKAREEAERKAREEAERKAREEAERKAREEAARKAREAAERRRLRIYAVGDYYNDGVREGVVFEVSADGRHGKIVSMKQSAEELPWTINERKFGLFKSEAERLIGADSKTDGAYNMAQVKAISGWRDKYPAFKWCADLGEGWYLPSIEELKVFTLNTAIHDAVNRTLIARGGTKLYDKGENGWYWSSTENNYKFSSGEFCAWIVDMYEGYTDYYMKYSLDFGYVRAVSAF